MIAIGSDHGGFLLKQEIKAYLEKKQIPYKDYGCYDEQSCDYAFIAKKVADAIVNGECEKGLLFCGTGIGISMAANKVHGIRAACCSDHFSTEMTRRHNDANILCMGGRVVGPGVASELVEVFLNTPFEGGRYQRRVDQITQIEEGTL